MISWRSVIVLAVTAAIAAALYFGMTRAGGQTPCPPPTNPDAVQVADAPSADHAYAIPAELADAASVTVQESPCGVWISAVPTPALYYDWSTPGP